MAVPKYKTSKSKTRSRVAQWTGVEEPSLSECDQCGTSKEPHRVCMECGYYNGRQVLNTTSSNS